MQFKFNPHAAVFSPSKDAVVPSNELNSLLTSALSFKDAVSKNSHVRPWEAATNVPASCGRAGTKDLDGRGLPSDVLDWNRQGGDLNVSEKRTVPSAAVNIPSRSRLARQVAEASPGCDLSLSAARKIQQGVYSDVVIPETTACKAEQGSLQQSAFVSPRQALEALERVGNASAQDEARSSWTQPAEVPRSESFGDAHSLTRRVPYGVDDGMHRPVGPHDFQAVREIGEGAFGKVYLVRSRITGRLYAMKVLSKKTVLRKEQVAYAMSERDVMCNLEHPYLVSLRFSFQTRHRLFLVMDYLEGGHLWLQMKSGFFSEDVARIFTAEIVLAIGHLHSLNIAHRDLKPENILLDSCNHLRLTDFGLAKKAMDADCRAHTMVGTIDYMAPEVVKNDGHGKAVDWWSLGVLLYEMLFAKLPFAPLDDRHGDKKGKNPKLDPSNEMYKVEVKKRIQHGKVIWPKGRFVNPVSKASKDLILKLLNKSPTERLGAKGPEDVMKHPFFKSVNWDGLMARKVPSPLASSIFRGAPDRIGTACIDPVPHPHDEHPCPKLAGYLFEKDTPPGSPRDSNLVELFRGFSYAQPSEFLRHMSANGLSDEDPFKAF